MNSANRVMQSTASDAALGSIGAAATKRISDGDIRESRHDRRTSLVRSSGRPTSRLSTLWIFAMVARLLCLVALGVPSSVRAVEESIPIEDSAFLQAGWSLASTPSELPIWFEENRVHALAPLPIRNASFGLRSPEFESAASGLKEMGVKIFTREFKSSCEDPWWPTRSPFDEITGEPLWDGTIRANGAAVSCEATHTVEDLCEGVSEAKRPEGCRDVAQEIIGDAHREGLKIIAYYWHMSDGTVATRHPDWVCKNLDGSTAHHRNTGGRGPHLDITTPYREIVLQRLLELAERGVDGFNFDFRHMPRPDGCFGTALQEAFEDATGVEIDTGSFIPHEENPDYRLFLEFQALKIEETFAYWKAAVKKRHPGIVFVISVDGIPSLGNRRVTTNLIGLADSAKNEYHQALSPRLNAPDEAPSRYVFAADADPLLAVPPPDIRMALGWTLLRDSANGRPPRIWGNHQPDEHHALGFAASILAYGGIAHMHVVPKNIFGHTRLAGRTPRNALEAALELGRRASPYLSRTRPLRWAAVHVSEIARNRRGGDLARAWQEVLWPATGAFEVFVRQGLPVGVVNDRQLETGEIEGYDVLFLPNPAELSLAQRMVVKGFESRGGVVIVNDPKWNWSDPDENAAALASFRSELQLVRENFPDAPVRVWRDSGSASEPTCELRGGELSGGPPKICLHAVAFEHWKSGRLVVTVTNDFSWVQRQKVERALRHPDEGEHFHWGRRRLQWDELHDPPPPIGNAHVFVSGRPVPKRIFEAISGSPLGAKAVPGGYHVRLPEFQSMAVLVME